MRNESWKFAAASLLALACGSNNDPPSSQTTVPDQLKAKSSLAYNANPVVLTTTQQAVARDLNNFGTAVFQSLAPSDQNFSTSPVSGFIALTMTSDGAQGTTANEMKSFLYPDVAISDIQAATNQLQQQVRGFAQPMEHVDDAGKQVVLNLANDVFAQKDYPFQQLFLHNLATNYDSGVELVDFKSNPNGATTQINNWVSNETNDPNITVSAT